MKTKLHISMRRSIELGLNFYEWRKVQPKQLEFSDAILQISYESFQEDMTYRKESKKEFIVLSVEGKPLERSRFIIHSSPTEASKEGIEKAGKGNFIIENYVKFKRTAAYRRASSLHIYLRGKEERLKVRKLNNTKVKIVSKPKIKVTHTTK